MLCIEGRTRENCLNECASSLKLLANPEQLISFEIEEEHDSMSRMMLPLTFAVPWQEAEKICQRKQIVIWFIWFVSFVWLTR